jgi:hypothetical protein
MKSKKQKQKQQQKAKQSASQRRNLYVSDADYDALQRLGEGNASAGVRLSIRLVRDFKLEDGL